MTEWSRNRYGLHAPAPEGVELSCPYCLSPLGVVDGRAAPQRWQCCRWTIAVGLGLACARELNRRAHVEVARQLRAGLRATACSQCGTLQNEDASAVLWVCRGCQQPVCRACTLTIPESSPPEYYLDTLCSRRCWEAVGEPDE